IGVVVDSTLKPNGVFTEESPDLGVVVSSSVVVEPRLGIPLPAREGISTDGAARLNLTEGVVSISEDRRAICVSQEHRAAQTVRVVVVRWAAGNLRREVLVDAQPLDESAHGTADARLQNVGSVVKVLVDVRRDCPRDASPDGVVRVPRDLRAVLRDPLELVLDVPVEDPVS